MVNLPDMSIPQYITTAAVQAVQAAVDNAVRLGLQWRLRPGTVGGGPLAQADSTPVTLDGDNAQVQARSMVGALGRGQRVWCVQIPPAGIYVIGVLGDVPALQRVYFTSNGTFITAAYGPFVRAEGETQGGGGAGGGAATTAAGEASAGAGGWGGNYARSLLTVAQLGASQAVTVGSGGTGVAGGTGNTGGVSSIGSLVSANGGVGGAVLAAANTIAVNSGETPNSTASGDFVRLGGSPSPAFRIPPQSAGGTGGDAMLGGGGRGGATNANGLAGRSYGGGGGGGRNHASQAATRTGGAGAPGIVIFTLYPH